MEEIYRLIILLNGLSDLERDIVVCLAHVYPKSISASQLARMIGVSIKARTLSRGVLQRLQENECILLDKLTPRMYAIRINHEHAVLSEFINLCRDHGDELRDYFLNRVDGES